MSTYIDLYAKELDFWGWENHQLKPLVEKFINGAFRHPERLDIGCVRIVDVGI